MTIRLLHVEDDLDILEIALMSFEMAGGFDVMQCDNGPEALRQAPEFRPDVMVFDLMMPQMSGLQLLEAIRQVDGFADTPVIFMTARAQAHESRDMIERGARGVIVKPFDPLTLGDQVRALLAAS
ncbi:Response regulator receiver domain-containing protein [Loktanella fryxellensis]|uniref:Response regulator receiver domain-containing protein n=1 Tax=Loktanella fryxellensis TaxID=245187 RepID=A0A1H8EBY5_9RHOB|nr:response regulator [Loktanella fryxellensis]SEN17081.1 Response regulator receiver domain-containing protein [Loktanella fryxellensis]